MKISSREQVYKITKSWDTEKPTLAIKTASKDPNQPAHTRSIISILNCPQRDLRVIGRWRRIKSRPEQAAPIRRLIREYIECKRYPEGPAVTRLYIISRLARQNYWIIVDAQYSLPSLRVTLEQPGYIWGWKGGVSRGSPVFALPDDWLGSK